MISLLPAGTLEISWEQYDWLNDYLSTIPLSEDSMAHSAAYFLHTGRNGLFLVRYLSEVALVAFHPNLNNAALVLPAGGHFAPSLWAHLCKSISLGGMDVTLARVTPRHAISVEQMECFDRIDELTLDWRYPAVVLETKKVSEMAGGTFSEYRRKVRRAGRKAPITTIDQRSIHYFEKEQAVLQMIEKWAATVSEIKDFDSKHLISSNRAAYFMGRHSINELACRLYFSEGRAIGFSASEMTEHSQTANGIAMCLDRDWVGCSEYMYWNEARIMHESGYNFYNINGSETASLDSFKLKLRPHERVRLRTFRLAGA